jgi:hypothetical protein
MMSRLALAGGSTRHSIFASAGTPDTASDHTGQLSTEFYVTRASLLHGFRYYAPASGYGSRTMSLWRVSDRTRVVAATTMPTPSGEGWVQQLLATPYALAADTRYRVSLYVTTGQSWARTAPYWSGNQISVAGFLVAPSSQNATDNIQGGYSLAEGDFPEYTYNTSGYFSDVIVG